MGMGIGTGMGVGTLVGVGTGICICVHVPSLAVGESRFDSACNKGVEALVRRDRDDFCLRSVIRCLRLTVRSG